MLLQVLAAMEPLNFGALKIEALENSRAQRQSLSLSASLFRSLRPFALTHTPKDPAKTLLRAVAAALEHSEFTYEQRN